MWGQASPGISARGQSPAFYYPSVSCVIRYCSSFL
jgi:hypothetical protein